ncbi:hypothetical protein PPERSA_05071 [Pseudocohnilembus persalinus]|uniref:Leucine Rich Repeat family protein n=1 Tax=Pseudocohnilembus persalinus TaxID=266149 RepID=A0A0V0QWN0_PSEPJ|nr:hypothetical protein PPERSA_05071 [Pseudocohnilembus persalinus]|eukprot:KRX06458.1 hypothetical protein PPERSA_05071 [Pseudocohnilembus persalinus]
MQQQNLRNQLDQQNKLINYLQKKFKESTGHDVDLPQTWSQFLQVDEKDAPILDDEEEKNINKQMKKNENDQGNQQDDQDSTYKIEQEEKEITFLQAVINLDLPARQPNINTQKKNAPTSFGSKKKQTLTTTFNPANPNHMVEVINLSNFATRNFNKASFKEFLNCIKDMRCLHSLVLQNNGIDDSFLEEIDILFNNQKIKKIDLSQNYIGKKGGMHIAKLLKDGVHHIEWLDLSRNSFSTETQVLTSILSGLKKQPELYHFCLDTNTHDTKLSNDDQISKVVISEQVMKFVKESKNLNSFGIIDSRLTLKSIQILSQFLASSQCQLTGLNLKFCFLSYPSVFELGKGLQRNRSLVKLDLSHNALDDVQGIYISRALKENVFLAELNLSKNNLNNGFAEHFAQSLRTNQTLWKCELQGNPIGQEGAEALLTVLHEDNESLESLGEINASNTNMGVLYVQMINKALRVNSVSKDVRSKLIEQQLDQKNADPKQTFYDEETNFEKNQKIIENEYDDYKLCKPILFTNDPNSDLIDFKIWNA